MAALVAALAVAGGALADWTQDYNDPTGDVTDANIDISNVKSYDDGNDVIAELRVVGSIETSNDTLYGIMFGSQSSTAGAVYGAGVAGIVYPDGDVSTTGVTISGNLLRATLDKAKLGGEASFRIFGVASRMTGTPQEDIAGPGYTGAGPGGIAAWVWILLVVVIVAVVVAVALVATKRKKEAPAAPPVAPYGTAPGAPYPQQPAPQYPQPPSQYPPPPPPPRP